MSQTSRLIQIQNLIRQVFVIIIIIIISSSSSSKTPIFRYYGAKHQGK